MIIAATSESCSAYFLASLWLSSGVSDECFFPISTGYSPLFIFRENARSLLACNVVRTRLDRNSVLVERNRTVRTWWNREKRGSKERERRKRKRKRREAAGSSCGATSFVVIVRRHYRSSSRRIFRISEVTRNNVTVYRLSAVRAVIRVSRFAKISGLSIPFSWPRSQT